MKTCGLESYVDPSSACRRIELIPLISANDFAIVHPRVSVSIIKDPRGPIETCLHTNALALYRVYLLPPSLSLSL